MDGEIAPDEVADLLGEDGVAVVDIRSRDAYERGHLPNSVNLPLPELPTSIERVGDADRVVTVCPHGKASVRAARLVAASAAVDDAATVESMAGGLEAWDGDLVADGATAGDDSDAVDAPF